MTIKETLIPQNNSVHKLYLALFRCAEEEYDSDSVINTWIVRKRLHATFIIDIIKRKRKTRS